MLRRTKGSLQVNSIFLDANDNEWSHWEKERNGTAVYGPGSTDANTCGLGCGQRTYFDISFGSRNQLGAAGQPFPIHQLRGYRSSRPICR